jgi:tetratricopeptide (TPR) repeat protein
MKNSGSYKPDPSEYRRQIHQGTVLVWVDATIDPTDDNFQQVFEQLRAVVNNLETLTCANECEDYLQGMKSEEAFIISSGSLGRQIVPKIHDMPQVRAIYIFCGDRTRHAEWAKGWEKIKGVHTDMESICGAIEITLKHNNHDENAMLSSPNSSGPTISLNKLDPLFMYTQLFKTTFLNMAHDNDSIGKFVAYCRNAFEKNPETLEFVEEFATQYRSSHAIWWYTRECFLYKVLNKSLRVLEADLMVDMGFLIHDLHQQIHRVYQAQLPTYRGRPFIVYRGQKLASKDFKKMLNSQGDLMAFNSFLSTSENKSESLEFACMESKQSDTIGVLFVITIDPAVMTAPFANIRELSAIPKEDELLFSTHTIFRIGEIEPMVDRPGIYQVQLKLTSDDDEQLRQLTESFELEIERSTGWDRIGRLLIKVNKLDKAKAVYENLLKHASNENDRAHYYHQLGYIQDDMGDYPTALSLYKRALSIQEVTVPQSPPDLAASHSSIGGVYDMMGDYSQALLSHKEALAIKERALPSNHPSIATSHNNIGLVYYNMNDYPNALSSYQKALAINKEALPGNHPNLARCHGNIGGVYDMIGDYQQALLSDKEALAINTKTLGNDHPDTRALVNHIELVEKQLQSR